MALPAYTLLMNVSADLMPITSDTGDTSSLAATLGKRALPKDEAPATICVKLYCFCVATINDVKFSEVKPLNASSSATITLTSPLALEISSATGPHFVPATKTETSPPNFFAAVNAFCVIGSNFSLLCSAMIKVLWNLFSC